MQFHWETGKPFRLTLGNRKTTSRWKLTEKEASAPRGQGLTMDLTIHESPVPLRKDEHGVVRVGDSRVTLDVVILEYLKGTSPEGIAHAYSMLQLADVYAVIAYYLHNYGEVNATSWRVGRRQSGCGGRLKRTSRAGKSSKQAAGPEGSVELQHATPRE